MNFSRLHFSSMTARSISPAWSRRQREDEDGYNPTNYQITLSTECPELQDGLQARVHDPLWLLARQWQFGEFKGEDTGSPAAAQVVIETAPISRYQPGPASSSNGIQSYSPLALALETLVEREAVIKDNIPNWRWAAEAGLHLIRLLNVEGVGSYRAVFLKSNYLLKPPTPHQRPTLDGDSQRFLNVVGGRVVDGVQLHSRLASLRDRNALAEFFQESPFETISTADRPCVVLESFQPSRGAICLDVRANRV